MRISNFLVRWLMMHFVVATSVALNALTGWLVWRFLARSLFDAPELSYVQVYVVLYVWYWYFDSSIRGRIFKIFGFDKGD